MIAVTGASGHIGANLVRALLAGGETVRVLTRDDGRATKGLAIEEVRGDVRDAASLRRCFEGADTVFHLAAQIAIGGEEEKLVDPINVEGTRNVTSVCLELKTKRLLHFSSIHALSPTPRDQVVDETRSLLDRPSAPPYDLSKAKAERVVLDAVDKGLDAVIVNPTGVIGPHDYKPSQIGTVLQYLRARKMPGVVEGGFNWVDARDVAAGAISAAKQGKKGERYLLSGEWFSMREFATVVEEVTGAKAPWFTSPMWLARVGAPFATVYARAMNQPLLFTSAALNALRDHRFISHDKATRELAFHPRQFKETVKAAFDWYDGVAPSA